MPSSNACLVSGTPERELVAASISWNIVLDQNSGISDHGKKWTELLSQAQLMPN